VIVRRALLFLAMATVFAAPRADLVQAQAKYDLTLRDFLWLVDDDRTGIPPSDDAGDLPFGGPIVFRDPPPIDFSIPGSGGECRADPTPEDGLPGEVQDDPPPDEEDLLGDDVGFQDPPPIDFPIPGSGGECPVGPKPEDALPQGPSDDAPPEEDAEEDAGDLLGGPIGFKDPPPIDFPIPGSGGQCPQGEGPDDYLTPRIWRTAARFDHNPDPVDDAPPDPSVQIVIATFPTLRYDLRPELVPEQRAPGGGGAAHEPDEPLRIYVSSLGRLGADAVEVTVLATEEESVELAGGAVVLEPVILSQAEANRLREERRRAAEERSEASGNADAYCLDIDREPPAEGTFLRIAEPAVQGLYDSHRRVLDAAARLRDAGRLVPDSDPESYFHSIRQWSIWTLTESLDEARFAESFVAHTRKNFEASDQAWSEAIEQAVRELAPGRWADIQRVLAAAAEQEDEERKGGNP
jgi:hypothetical protein